MIEVASQRDSKPSNVNTAAVVPMYPADIVITTLWSAGDAVPPCKHITLVADDHEEVEQMYAATFEDAVLSRVAKLRPVTVRLRVVENAWFESIALLTKGAGTKNFLQKRYPELLAATGFE